jgi:catechol 2,3-dioxygenase-like lactoylglutathione lyase family enzyme
MKSKIATDSDDDWAALVPELLVRDLATSLEFYLQGCGFRLRYARPEDGFAYLALGRAQLMLEEVTLGCWQTAPLRPPFGRGMNLQIEVADVHALHDRLQDRNQTFFRPLSTEWYRDGHLEHGQTQFLVQDPDGYLLRFMQHLETRPWDPERSG